MNKLNINEIALVSGGFWPVGKIAKYLCSCVFCCKKAHRPLADGLIDSFEIENFEIKEKRGRSHGILWAKDEHDYMDLMDNSKDETRDSESLFSIDSVYDGLSSNSDYKIHTCK